MIMYHAADIDIRDNQGNTALIWAARVGSAGVVKRLLERCARVDIVNHNNESAFSEGKGYKMVTSALENVPKYCGAIDDGGGGSGDEGDEEEGDENFEF